MSNTDYSAINPDIVTTQIPALDIPAETLENFSFIAKTETENPAYQLLASGALTGYLVAEQINAIRDIVSGLYNSLQNYIIPTTNKILNHPAKFSKIHSCEEFSFNFKETDIYNNSIIKQFKCDFLNEKNSLYLSSLLEVPEILIAKIPATIEPQPLYFPKISLFEITKSSEKGISTLGAVPVPSDTVVTFQIWIALEQGAKISTISLPQQYLILDNEEAFPSQLESNLLDNETTSMVYVFPVRISNIQEKPFPDVQVSYAYRFIAGLNNKLTDLEENQTIQSIDETTSTLN